MISEGLPKKSLQLQYPGQLFIELNGGKVLQAVLQKPKQLAEEGLAHLSTGTSNISSLLLIISPLFSWMSAQITFQMAASSQSPCQPFIEPLHAQV
jgi:hypothetical protein